MPAYRRSISPEGCLIAFSEERPIGFVNTAIYENSFALGAQLIIEEESRQKVNSEGG
jgi:hypothetical protein